MGAPLNDAVWNDGSIGSTFACVIPTGTRGHWWTAHPVASRSSRRLLGGATVRKEEEDTERAAFALSAAVSAVNSGLEILVISAPRALPYKALDGRELARCSSLLWPTVPLCACGAARGPGGKCRRLRVESSASRGLRLRRGCVCHKRASFSVPPPNVSSPRIPHCLASEIARQSA